jgi:hypothetical protein
VFFRGNKGLIFCEELNSIHDSGESGLEVVLEELSTGDFAGVIKLVFVVVGVVIEGLLDGHGEVDEFPLFVHQLIGFALD